MTKNKRLNPAFLYQDIWKRKDYHALLAMLPDTESFIVSKRLAGITLKNASLEIGIPSKDLSYAFQKGINRMYRIIAKIQ